MCHGRDKKVEVPVKGTEWGKQEEETRNFESFFHLSNKSHTRPLCKHGHRATLSQALGLSSP